MRRGSQTLLLGAMALTLTAPGLSYAKSAADTVKQYTRNEQNYVYITQSVLALADTAALGVSVKAYMMLRPKFTQMSMLQQSIRDLEAKERQVKIILDRVETGQLALTDDYSRQNLIHTIEGEVEALKKSQGRMASAVQNSMSQFRVDAIERHELERQVSYISGVIEGRKGAINTLKSIKVAATFEESVGAISKELQGVREDLAKTKSALAAVKGNIIARAAKSGLRLVATAAGLVAVTDLGTRAYVVFVENADPGTFPVLEIAAQAYDQNKVEAERARQEIERTIENAKEIGSAMFDNVDVSKFPTIR